MNIKKYILDLQKQTDSIEIGLFGSAITQLDHAPGDIDLYFEDCKVFPNKKLIEIGINSNVIKSVSLNAYGDTGGGYYENPNGFLDLSFFTSDISFKNFLNYDNKVVIEQSVNDNFFSILQSASQHFIETKKQIM